MTGMISDKDISDMMKEISNLCVEMSKDSVNMGYTRSLKKIQENLEKLIIRLALAETQRLQDITRDLGLHPFSNENSH